MAVTETHWQADSRDCEPEPQAAAARLRTMSARCGLKGEGCNARRSLPPQDHNPSDLQGVQSFLMPFVQHTL